MKILNLFGEEIEISEEVQEVEEKLETFSTVDWVYSIKTSKLDLRKHQLDVKRGTGKNARTVTVLPDPQMKSFNAYSVLLNLSQDDKLLPICEIMNENSMLTKEQVYLFLMNAIPQHKKYVQWYTKPSEQLEKDLMKLFDYSRAKIKELFITHSIDELKEIVKNETKKLKSLNQNK